MSIATEQQVIYSLLTENSLLQNCDLEPKEFQQWQNQEIYGAIREISDGGGIADLMTVIDRLSEKMPDHDFATYIAELVERGHGKSGFDQHCQIVRKDHRKRQALEIAQTMMDRIKSNQQEEAVDSAIQSLMALNTVGKNYDHGMLDVMRAATTMVSDAHEMDGIKGISTGLDDLNDTLGGFHKTDLIVIGARPAMGKTAFMLNLALAAKEPVGIISAEQGHEQIGLRLVSVEGKVDSQKLRTGGFYDDEWNTFGMAVRRLADKPIRINDEPAITISKVIRQARDWKYKYGIKALYVDYLQKIEHSDKSQPRHIQVGEIARALKNLGRELDIPVIALAQVNRNCENRPDKRPHNSDLADAGEIEKEADVIMFMYRDEVYNEDSPDKGIAELIASKNRHGPIGTIRCVFVGKFMRFEQISARRYGE
jgi:replicative DNA helicase